MREKKLSPSGLEGVRGQCDPVPIKGVPSSGPQLLCPSRAPSEVRFSFSAWIHSHPGDFKHHPPLLRGSFAQQLQGLLEQGGVGAQGLAAPCPESIFQRAWDSLLNLSCKGRKLLNEVADPGFCTTTHFVPLLTSSIC